MKTTRRGFLGLVGLGVSTVLARNVASRVVEISEKPGCYPLLYTTHNGGRWQQWPSETAVTEADLNQRSTNVVRIGSRWVHSLRFWEHKGEFIGWRRWDCVNGWNRIPKFAGPLSDDVDRELTTINHALLNKMTEDGIKRRKRRK